MPGTPTTRYGLPTMAGATDLGSTIDDTFNSAMATIDTKMAGWDSGLESAKPAAGVAGRRWRSTDTGVVWLDIGSAWARDFTTTAALGVLTNSSGLTPASTLPSGFTLNDLAKFVISLAQKLEDTGLITLS